MAGAVALLVAAGGLARFGATAGAAEIPASALQLIVGPLKAHWTQWTERAQEGPWTAVTTMQFHLAAASDPGAPRGKTYDVRVFQYVRYRGPFPPVLLREPGQFVLEPTGASLPSVPGRYLPYRLPDGTFVYGLEPYSTANSPSSRRGVVRAFDRATARLVWRAEPWLPLTRAWGVGRLEHLTIRFRRSTGTRT